MVRAVVERIHFHFLVPHPVFIFRTLPIPLLLIFEFSLFEQYSSVPSFTNTSMLVSLHHITHSHKHTNTSEIYLLFGRHTLHLLLLLLLLLLFLGQLAPRSGLFSSLPFAPLVSLSLDL